MAVGTVQTCEQIIDDCWVYVAALILGESPQSVVKVNGPTNLSQIDGVGQAYFNLATGEVIGSAASF